MKMTANRMQILAMLDSSLPDCGYFPPYSASSLQYALYGLDDSQEQTHLRQIRRTLADLTKAGLLTKTTQVEPPLDKGLSQRVQYFEVTDRAAFWQPLKAMDGLYTKVKTACVGIQCFGAAFGSGATAEDVEKMRTAFHNIKLTDFRRDMVNDEYQGDMIDTALEQWHKCKVVFDGLPMGGGILPVEDRERVGGKALMCE